MTALINIPEKIYEFSLCSVKLSMLISLIHCLTSDLEFKKKKCRRKSHFVNKQEKQNLRDTDSSMVVTREKGGGVVKGKGDQSR